MMFFPTETDVSVIHFYIWLIMDCYSYFDSWEIASMLIVVQCSVLTLTVCSAVFSQGYCAEECKWYSDKEYQYIYTNHFPQTIFSFRQPKVANPLVHMTVCISEVAQKHICECALFLPKPNCHDWCWIVSLIGHCFARHPHCRQRTWHSKWETKLQTLWCSF